MQTVRHGLALPLLLASCAVSVASAQNAVSTGAVAGTVTDASGAVIPGANVELANTGTGIDLQSVSNSSGFYTFPALPVGVYRLHVRAPGFKDTELNGVQVNVGHLTNGDAMLAVGSAGDVVSVDAESASTLNHGDTTIGMLLEKHTIDHLPLSGRRYTDFVLLTPNVTTDGQFGHITFAGQSGGTLSGYGNANGASSFTVDGADATSYYYGDNRGFTRIPYVFGLQAVQEFQVQPNVYNSAYGGAGAGFINTVTKSGTNRWHGDLFYYNRNSATGANDALDKAAGNSRPLNVLQQFGADLSGPILPNKMFFYFDYEQQRHKFPLYIVNQAYSTVDQTDFGVAAGTALPAPNAHYPTALSLSENDLAANPNNAAYLQNVSNALNLIRTNLVQRQRRRDEYEFFPKVDWQVGPKDHLTMLYNYAHFETPGGIITFSPEGFGGAEALGNNGVRDHVATIHWTHIFTPSLVNDTHVSYVRDEQIYKPSGLAGSPTSPQIVLLQGHAAANSFFLLGNPTYVFNNLREYQVQFAEHLTFTRGNHQMDFGYDLNRDSIANNSFGGFYGLYTFTTLKDFGLGKWNFYQQNAGNPKFNFADPFMGFYVNDTWKATNNLTLSMGLREDFQLYPNPAGNPALPFSQTFHNQFQRVSPRLGISYSPSTKTVVRGGAGLYYELFVGSNYQNSTQTSGVASQQASLSLSDFSANTAATSQPVTFPGVLPNTSPGFAAGSNIAVINPSFKTPSIINASLQVDQQVAHKTVLTLGSMWSHGMHLTASTAYDMNLKPPTGTTTYTLPNRTVVLPNINNLQSGLISNQFGQINSLFSPGINNYVSFFTTLNRQMSDSASVVVSYTLSKATQSGLDFYNQFDLSGTHGLSLLDQRHRLSVATVYSPQFERVGRKERQLLNNWTLSLIGQVNSGRPYPAVVSNLNNTATNQSTPNTGNGLGGNGLAPGEGMNGYTGPWLTEVDTGLQRNFNIAERHTFTLKAQAFNLLNTPNYYVQNGGINELKYNSSCNTDKSACTLTLNNGVGGFGTKLNISQLNPPRIFQFSFSYSF